MIRKTKRQMTMTTAEIAELYANWPAAKAAPVEDCGQPNCVECGMRRQGAAQEAKDFDLTALLWGDVA